MGSFNETCALSNFNISPGTPVRLLFLTRNPYVSADDKEGQRGCLHNDQWFVRTPPIKGTYDDYGRCAFEESPLTDLICKVFQTDVVERPFGSNPHHTGDVSKNKGIRHFLHAAWQGRLLVEGGSAKPKPVPRSFPTWEKVHALLKKADLPLQLDSIAAAGQEGYNARPVIRGVVCVTYNSYLNNRERLQKAVKVLEWEYDVRFVVTDDAYNYALLVVPKGAFQNTALLHNDEVIRAAITENPDRCYVSPQLPVLAVMIREDVWQVYATVNADDAVDGNIKSVETVRELIQGKLALHEMHMQEFHLAGTMITLPFQTTPSTHGVAAGNDFPAREELLADCAELSRIEMVMGRLQQPWYIPPLGGQQGRWALRTQLLTDLLAISHKEAELDH